MLTIELLGRPAVRAQDGNVDSPRDRKTRALLAYLILASDAPTRQRLAELLYPQTNDPLAGVRWNLAQVRRLLGAGAVIDGDPVRLRLPASTTVDVDVLLHGGWSDAAALPLHQDLLGGLTFDSAPAFELWFTAARRRVRAAAQCCTKQPLQRWSVIPTVRWSSPSDSSRWIRTTRTITCFSYVRWRCQAGPGSRHVRP